MKFSSRGKLLLSGEYLILKGAKALAVPLIKGQELEVKQSGPPNTLKWISREYGKTWFSASFALPFFETVESTSESIASNLRKQLSTIAGTNQKFLESLSGSEVITDLQFKREWGFGSSSTLLSNLAAWAGQDPYLLNNMLTQGSGYDVVAARQEGPFFFNRHKDLYQIEEIDLHPELTRGLYFVYLGKKEATAKNVAQFLSDKKSYRVAVKQISDLSLHMGKATNLEDFGYYMKEHEQIVASVLRKPMLKEGLFRDLAGEAKSLGAWGGDFAMVTWNDSQEELKTYLLSKKLDTFFSFKKLVKTR